ncbi:hypothetical protein PoB_005735700 [Plakobranchus ocellatus]|uniref:Secreted protein n=1 Tax=Plakobranchus ocellatus TaxID=259542 RepID=A0AAV4CGZ7_9GAST|nr:hypothetical protein PoB_005735700 [Plakobranchus ocellatus]
MFGSRKTTFPAFALLACLVVIVPCQGARLPRFLCDFYRSLFVDLGCVRRESGLCRIINNLMTDELFGIPACDYFPCSGYGRNAGRCRNQRRCRRSNPNGICNRGLLSYFPLTFTDRQSTDGSSSSSSSGSSSSSSGSSGSFAVDNVGNIGSFAIDKLPVDFADNDGGKDDGQ